MTDETIPKSATTVGWCSTVGNYRLDVSATFVFQCRFVSGLAAPGITAEFSALALGTLILVTGVAVLMLLQSLK
uniref:Uncharacterized protein n=1 Tax=Tanacetum cinerariifolium TaxID=118510 RepID=A0A6L2IZI9_TANCI|nr:hypothetical protein [Tanacetum cinerariifolium]